MSLLVTGSLGVDTLETPTGKRDGALGGSALYFSFAARLFTPVRLVGVVGEDVPQELLEVFKGYPIDTAGLEIRKGSKTFRWHGSYLKDMNEAVTVGVQLNVLAEQGPKIPSQFCDSEFVFLANTHPALQQQMLASLKNVKLSVADTMNYWIANEPAELRKLLGKIDGLVLNDGEARLLTGEKNLVAAARQVLKMGPKFVVVKKGRTWGFDGEQGPCVCGSGISGRCGRRSDRRWGFICRRDDGLHCITGRVFAGGAAAGHCLWNGGGDLYDQRLLAGWAQTGQPQRYRSAPAEFPAGDALLAFAHHDPL